MPDETKTKTTPDGLAKWQSAVSHKKNFIVIKRKKGIVLEFEDVLFHHDSAVLLPSEPEGPSSTEGTEQKEQKKLTGLEVIRAVYMFCQENPLQRLVIAGHTDTSGPTKYNFDLSKLRSQAVQYVLLGNRFGWQGVVSKKNKVEDYQQILTHYADRYGYDCDPGGITGTNDQQTKDAVKKFQKTYNLEFSKTILEDGIVGEETWGAFFDLYMKELTELMGEKSVDKLQPWRDKVKFIDPMKKIVPCGESIPIDSPGMDGLHSQTNRRIEFVFFHQDDPPVINCPPSGNTLHPRETCPLYNDWVKRDYIDPATLEALGPSVEINTLDKWFIPGPLDAAGETCQIEYVLSGGGGFANKVVMNVYASHYSEATDKDDGSITFKELTAAVPVYEQTQPPEKSQPGEQYEIAEWHGQSNATKGILKPRAGTGRYINVANSPYTVHLRYFKDSSDKDARIELGEFWPQWDSNGDSIENSRKIAWKIEKTSKLKYGKLFIFDKDDDVVFEHELAADKVSQGTHDYQWDGKLKDGSSLSKNEMPYRLQIQAHSDGAEKNGVALAAMHTEVRLYVHKETGTKKPEEAVQEANSFKFALAPYVTKEPDENSEEDAWYQYKLAEAGFHPGPVTGTFDDATKMALKEFQRSNPKNTASPFERLTADGNKNPDTKAALKRLTADARPMFGDPANQNDYSRADAQTRLNDNGKDKNIVVWVDDRHYYTDPTFPPGPAKALSAINYRSWMFLADDRTTRDAASICRPWIPLQVSLSLLSRQHDLNSTVTPPVEGSDAWETVRRAIGPVRVDWTFDEFNPELSVIDTTKYNHNKARTRKYVEWVLDKNKKEHQRKDNNVKVTYKNCPEKYGGIRPSDITKYYQAAFGTGTSSLQPWPAKAVDAVESIATFVHDDLGQAKEKLHDKSVGQAAVYFNPSRIAGDCYRVRSAIRFEKCDGYDFPNVKVLAARYDKLPKAHSSGMVNWRKSSIRGYMFWAGADPGHWDGYMTGFRDYYRATNVHFVHESGTATSFPLADVFDHTNNTHKQQYRDIIKNNTFQPLHKTDHPEWAKLNDKYVWPWVDRDDLGWPWSAPPDTTRGKLYDDWLSPVVIQHTWREFRDELLMDVLREIEKKHGKLKGHLLLEFTASPQYYVEEYVCDGTGAGACGSKYYYLEKNEAGGRAAGRSCPASTCSGHHRRKQKYTGKYKCANCNLIWNLPNDNASGDSGVGEPCPDCGAPHTLTKHAAPTATPIGTEHPGYDTLPLPAVGLTFGATWLFTNSNEDTWAHEVAHHRQLEHAADAPGAQYAPHDPNDPPNKGLHDSKFNSEVAWPAGTSNANRRWDRDCIMSYTTGESLYFCGKCVLRNRGWKIQKLGYPASNVKGT